MGLQGPDIEKIIHLFSICILVFINEGSSSLTNCFMNEPWSWGLSIPISLYFKFALELHAHLGICVGVGAPALVYWGATRNPIDWYWEIVLKFNNEILKTGLFNIFIGVLHLVVSKLIKHLIEWVKDRIMVKGSKLQDSPTSFNEQPLLLRPLSSKEIILKMIETFFSFFCNGNVLLLSWCFSGQMYTHEVGKAISWVSLGSSMFVWTKALLKPIKMPTEEKAYKKMDKNLNFSIDYKESKDQAITCSSEC